MTRTEHWSKRLNRAMRAKGWKPVDLIRATGLDKSAVHSWLGGRVGRPRPPADDILANALGVDKSWLLDGAENITLIETSVATRRIPVLTLRQCGELTRGQLAELAGGEFYPVGADVGPRSAAVRVEDTALGSLFQPGDLAVVDPDAEISPNNVVLVVVDKKAYLRRYSPQGIAPGSAVTLIAEHPFPSFELPPNGRIVGRVVKRISDV